MGQPAHADLKSTCLMTMNRTPAISISHLSKTWGDGPAAVQDLSLTIYAGELFGLLGPNGAGKTTTLRCLCSLTQPDAGAIQVMGLDALANPRALRQMLGYIAQEVALDKVLTGRELLQLQAALYHLPKAQIPRRIDAALEMLNLTEYADRLIGTYSGGLKKRLDIAAGLLHEPKILVLDEPTVGLDIESRQLMWDFLRRLKSQGTTVVLTSHYLEEVDALSDRVAIIDRGQVIAQGEPSALKTQLGGDRITLRLKEFTPIDEALQAKKLLESLDLVQNVIINGNQGNALNLVVASGVNASGGDRPVEGVLFEVQQVLQSANLPIFGIAQAKPSLDDVYLAATGRTLVDAELASDSKRK
jgi:ABC-2 type transport system ATP-binding protein